MLSKLEELGLDPAVANGVLLLRGLALGVAVRRSEVNVVLGNGGPKEGAGVCASKVYRYVKVVLGDRNKVAGLVLVVDEEGSAWLARFHLGVDLALKGLVASVLLVLVASVVSFGGNAFGCLLDDLHQRSQQGLQTAALHLLTVVFVLVHRVVSCDDVFVVSVVRHFGNVYKEMK